MQYAINIHPKTALRNPTRHITLETPPDLTCALLKNQTYILLVRTRSAQDRDRVPENIQALDLVSLFFSPFGLGFLGPPNLVLTRDQIKNIIFLIIRKISVNPQAVVWNSGIPFIMRTF